LGDGLFVVLLVGFGVGLIVDSNLMFCAKFCGFSIFVGLVCSVFLFDILVFCVSLDGVLFGTSI